jgi:L-ascorbate metabolism protein UlaG (beta-lactamase superfamily)
VSAGGAALRWTCAATALLLAVSCGGAERDESVPFSLVETRPLEVTCLANAGYLVSHEGRAVLVDALFDINVDPALPPRLHDHLDPERQAVVEAALPPFDGVELVLVTHGHDDHFTPGAVASFLDSNRRATLVCPGDVAERVRRAGPDPVVLEGRIRSLDPDPGTTAETRWEGLSVRALGLPHTGRTDGIAGHNGYLVEIGPHRFLHLGDASATADDFDAFGSMLGDEIDVVFAPYWFVMEPGGMGLLRERLRPRHVVVTHAHRGNRDELSERVGRLPGGPPEVTLFEATMERRYF